MQRFQPTSQGSNLVWSISPGTYLSYASHPCGGIDLYESDQGAAETALVLDRKYYILNGDWRQAYCDAFDAGGIEACIQLFVDHQSEHGSSWTTGTPREAFIAARIANLRKRLEALG